MEAENTRRKNKNEATQDKKEGESKRGEHTKPRLKRLITFRCFERKVENGRNIHNLESEL